MIEGAGERLRGAGDRVGWVQTVRGLVDPSELGRVMMHEHLLLDARCLIEPAPAHLGADFAHQPVSSANRADVIHHPCTNLDDLLLDDEAVAIDEVNRYRAVGGGTIVDTTTIGLARNASAVRRISEATGVHVTMGTGVYCYLCHPPEIEGMSEDGLAELMAREIEDGVDDTGIRAGHIGEIGCQVPTDAELKVLRAAARAQRRTGAMLSIHQVHRAGDEKTLHRILDTIEDAGGSISRTVLGHMDRTGAEPDLQASLLARGVTIEYDLFGYEAMHAAWEREPPQDVQRIRDFRRLIEAGFGDQLVVAQDICFKTMMVAYGGWGYGHILRRVVPGFLALGVSEAALEQILVGTPRRLLTFVAPGEPAT